MATTFTIYWLDGETSAESFENQDELLEFISVVEDRCGIGCDRYEAHDGIGFE